MLLCPIFISLVLSRCSASTKVAKLGIISSDRPPVSCQLSSPSSTAASIGKASAIGSKRLRMWLRRLRLRSRPAILCSMASSAWRIAALLCSSRRIWISAVIAEAVSWRRRSTSFEAEPIFGRSHAWVAAIEKPSRPTSNISHGEIKVRIIK